MVPFEAGFGILNRRIRELHQDIMARIRAGFAGPRGDTRLDSSDAESDFSSLLCPARRTYSNHVYPSLRHLNEVFRL
jgi:hypothetical protein